MKCDYKKALLKAQAEPILAAYDTAKRMWEMATLIALHKQFGFGAARLEKAARAIESVYAEIDKTAARTDAYQHRSGSRPYSDIESALIGMVRELRSIGIDHRETLGDCELILTDSDGKQKNIDDIVDWMEQREKDWRKLDDG